MTSDHVDRAGITAIRTTSFLIFKEVSHKSNYSYSTYSYCTAGEEVEAAEFDFQKNPSFIIIFIFFYLNVTDFQKTDPVLIRTYERTVCTKIW